MLSNSDFSLKSGDFWAQCAANLADGFYHAHLCLLFPAAVPAGVLQPPGPLEESLDYAGQLCLLRVVATVVCQPDAVHNGDRFSLGQSDHAGGCDSRREEACGHCLCGDEPDASGILQVLHVRGGDAESTARCGRGAAVSGADGGAADWDFVLHVPLADLHRRSVSGPRDASKILLRFFDFLRISL